MRFLSFGGGVNSTALLLLLTDRGEHFETVFVNHGGDHPDTYKYIDYLREQGFEIHETRPNHHGHQTLYDYCIAKKIMPTVFFRWCTHYFKVLPYLRYIEPHLPCVSCIGFDADEGARVKKNMGREIRYRIEHMVENHFPLYEEGIDRDKCLDIIREHGLRVPPKSGCYFCPFQRKTEYRNMFLNTPELFHRVVELERNCVSKNNVFLCGGKPISEVAMMHTPAITSYCEGD